VPGAGAATADNNTLFRQAASTLQAKSLAIVGASERARWPSEIYRNLREFGYPGRIALINPRQNQVFGERCYPSLRELPDPVDHALVIVPASAVPAVLTDAEAAGIASATVYASMMGDGEHPDSQQRGAWLKEFVSTSRLRVAGPNCMGAYSFRERVLGYPNTELCRLEPGPVACIFQSGGLIQFWMKSAADRGLRFSYCITSGNEPDLGLADYLNFVIDDPQTRQVVLFIEGIRRPRAFMHAAGRALAMGKPILAIKTGVTAKSQAGSQSHTGAIAGDYGAFTAMCERYGIVVCRTLDEMIETQLVFQAGRLPKGPRVGWVTTSGGTVDLLYDYLEEQGGVATPEFSAATKEKLRPLVSHELTLKNPLDAGNPINDASDVALCAAVAADPNVDMLAWGGTPPTGKRVRDATLTKTIVQNTDKPVVGFIRMGCVTGKEAVDFQEEVGFPFLQGLPAVINSLSALAFYGARTGRKIAPLAPPKGKAETLHGAAFEAALTRHGLTPPKSGLVISPSEAAALATRIGFPVALKIVSKAISHKTEAGGVRLNLASAEQVENAAHALVASAAKAAPDAKIDGFQVQEMVDGVEVILGARTDPLYGPMLVVGSGGILVELVKDVAFRLLPVTREDARAMIGELKVAKLLAGFRGKPAGDVDALVQAICGLSDFYLEHRHLLSDLEINPLMVLAKGNGVRAVDVRPVFPGTR
jgi:acetyltransferase